MFLNQIKKRYNIVTEPKEINRLYIDLNFIFIKYCQYDENFIIDSTLKYLESIINQINPLDLIFLSLDGVQQKCHLNNLKQKTHYDSIMAKQNSTFSHCNFLPQTDFILKFEQKLQEFSNKLFQKIIIISNSNVPGNSQAKIFEFIRNQQLLNKDDNIKHLIIGSDQNFILYALGLHQNNIFVMLENELFSIDTLIAYLDSEFKYLQLPFAYNLDRIIDDIILLTLFMGIDILPQLHFLLVNNDQQINILFYIYTRVLPFMTGYLTEKGEIILKNLAILLRQFGIIEIILIANKNRKILFEQKEINLEFKQIYDEIYEQKMEELQKKYQEQKNDINNQNQDKNEDLVNIDKILNPNLEEETKLNDLIDNYMNQNKIYNIDKKNLENQKQNFNDIIIDYSKYYERFMEGVSIQTSYNQNISDESITYNYEYLENFKQIFYDEKKKNMKSELNLQKIQKQYLDCFQYLYLQYTKSFFSNEWQYQFDFSPFMSDLDISAIQQIKTEKSEYLQIYPYLLSILNKNCSEFINQKYQQFIVDENSEIADLYKQEDNIVPMVDEQRIIQAIKDIEIEHNLNYIQIKQDNLIKVELIDQNYKLIETQFVNQQLEQKLEIDGKILDQINQNNYQKNYSIRMLERFLSSTNDKNEILNKGIINKNKNFQQKSPQQGQFNKQFNQQRHQPYQQYPIMHAPHPRMIQHPQQFYPVKQQFIQPQYQPQQQFQQQQFMQNQFMPQQQYFNQMPQNQRQQQSYKNFKRLNQYQGEYFGYKQVHQ